MFLFPKWGGGLVMRGGGFTSHRSTRGRGFCPKRLWKVQGKLPFCDRHSDHHINLPILPFSQSYWNCQREIMIGGNLFLFKTDKRSPPTYQTFQGISVRLHADETSLREGFDNLQFPLQKKVLLREEPPPETVMLPRLVVAKAAGKDLSQESWEGQMSIFLKHLGIV